MNIIIISGKHAHWFTTPRLRIQRVQHTSELWQTVFVFTFYRRAFSSKPSHYILFFCLFSSFTEVFINWDMKVKVAESCPTLFNPMDYTVHGILQARILEWAAVSFSRGSSQPRNRTRASWIAGRFFTNWAIQEDNIYPYKDMHISVHSVISSV